MSAFPFMLCKNGHPVTKLKSLKAWQGHLHGKECAICGNGIGRDELRWRCERHCAWDMCQSCYDRHWSEVIRTAVQERSSKRSCLLLSLVPAERRTWPDYAAAAQQYRQRGAASEPIPPIPTPPAPCAEASAAERHHDPPVAVEVAFWLAIELMVPSCFAATTRAVLGDAALMFPHPLLLAGLTQGASFLLVCSAASCLAPAPGGAGHPSHGSHGSRGPPLPPPPMRPTQRPPEFELVDEGGDPGWKPGTMLGFMYGVEVAINAHVLGEVSASTRDMAFVLTPAFLFLADTLSHTERVRTDLLAWVGCAMLGGLLPARSDPSDSPGSAPAVLPLALLSGAVTALRWVITMNIMSIPLGSKNTSRRFALVLASRMLPTVAALSFELAFLTDWRAYLAVWELPRPGHTIALVALAAALSAMLLISELRLAQLASLTLVGFVSPIGHAAFSLLAVVARQGVAGMPASSWAGLVCCTVAVWGYVQARRGTAAVAAVAARTTSTTQARGGGPCHYTALPAEPPGQGPWSTPYGSKAAAVAGSGGP